MLNEIKNDIPSSIVMFFVAVQLCLGIALASGVPLFSWIIAGIVVSIASGSPLGISSPTVGLAVIFQLIVGGGDSKRKISVFKPLHLMNRHNQNHFLRAIK